MSSKRGTLTIEASIVLPIFITIILGVLYLIKGFYIQNEIESAMTKVAHELAVHAYVVDQTGLISIQQNLYNDGLGDYETVTSSINSVIANGQTILSMEGTINTDVFIPWIDVEALPEVKESDSLEDMIRVSAESLKRAPVMFDSVYDNILSLQGSMIELYEVILTSIDDVAITETIEYANGKVADGICKQSFKKYVSDDQLMAWGVSFEEEWIDFGDSSIMLSDDTIQIVSKYIIQFPLLPQLFDGVPIYQSVMARAYTGSYDSEEDRSVIDSKGEKEEKIYFIATETPENYCYHYYSCLVKELSKSTYGETVTQGRGLCQYCKTHYIKSRDIGELENSIVYFTSLTSKIHLSETCPRIKAIIVEAVSVEEAIERGYGKPCDKYGCVAKTEGIE
jgi:hypothetical protein